ncbi:MAG: repair protein RecN [Acidimicrobiia bacterium]|nr:repair protein RecN [Acidimicrobiia bacterium]
MLEELHVRQLGVIDELTLPLGSGMTALTGETGAGKTLVVTAIELLVGGRAEPILVRPGAAEARVDGRFTSANGEETVISRVVPREGRSRAYIDGRPASLNELAELGRSLVDLHGQHAHQSLLDPAAQRRALDLFAGIDLQGLRAAVTEVRRLDAELAELGGDDSVRARELELLRFQLDEIEAAQLGDPEEDAALGAEEDRLGDAQAHQEAAALAHELVSGDGGAIDRLATAIGAIRDRGPFVQHDERARALEAELADLATDLRGLAETLEPDPERLATVRARRQQLRDLQRKYGDGGVGSPVEAVLAAYQALSDRAIQLETHEERAAALQAARDQALVRLAAEQVRVGAARREAAPRLAADTQANLAQLAMPRALLQISVAEEDPGDNVTFELAANPGSPLLPLAKVASGGELARTMLALRLALQEAERGRVRVLRDHSGQNRDHSGQNDDGQDLDGRNDDGQSIDGQNEDGQAAGGAPDGPATMIFDEVDAGIGGAAATAVGEALARLGDDRQVLVVTHLAQVAAWGHAQVAVTKAQNGQDTVSLAQSLEDDERLVELARMLSGSPESDTARRHAAELLDAARRRINR